ncbi:MAG: LamG-like jellyroll fold domain-containing protein, partial [Thiohalomonadales bacterium]
LHRCTKATCEMWAGEIQAGIVAWATATAGSQIGAGVTGSSILSASLTLADGVKNSGAGRVEDAIIAKYTFKTGNGTTAFDTSGITPAIDLTLSEGVTWVSGQGIEITDLNAAGTTKAVATPATSKKLYDKIAGPTGSKEYTIEAWIINDNTALTGPARIVSYSLNAQNRNFTMGQITAYYNFRNRSDLTGNSGSNPALDSAHNDDDLKAELQHVVMTFDQTNGRNIYVNGIKTAYEGVASDPSVPADISNWNDTYTFILGNEVPDNVERQWIGKMLFVAIHDRSLNEAEILKNTLEGVGDKFILNFDVSTLLDASGATTSTISVVASEFDAFSYLFGKPTLTTDIPVPNIPVKNIQIAVNSNIPAAAQAFRNVNTIVTATDAELSPLGAVIPMDKGADLDQFALVFAVLGNNSNIIVEQNPSPVPDLSIADPSPEQGLRTFEQINNTMSVLTGVDASVTAPTFDGLRQQLPSTPNLGSFVSAHQIGVAKLSLEYCDVMVESNALRSSFFGNTFDFNAAVSTAFSNQAKRDIITGSLINKMVGTNLSKQPTLAELRPELDQLITELSVGCNIAADCNAARTRTIVKASCAAVLGSAAVLID